MKDQLKTLNQLETIWNHLIPAEYALTISWAIYTLGKVIRRLDTIGVNLGLEDEIGALTLLLEKSEEPPVILWGTYKEEVFSLLAALRKSLQDADSHEGTNDLPSGGQFNGS